MDTKLGPTTGRSVMKPHEDLGVTTMAGLVLGVRSMGLGMRAGCLHRTNKK